jgi:hypothetical protein
VYSPGDILYSVSMVLNEKFDITEKFRYFSIFPERKVGMLKYKHNKIKFLRSTKWYACQ